MSKKYLRFVIIALVVSLLLSCQALSFLQKAEPTEEEEVATATRRPTRTSVPPTSTPEPIITEAPVDDYFVYYDDFGYDQGYWALGYYPGDYADANYAIEDNVYKWSVYSHQTANERAWPGIDSLTDFSVIVDAMQTTSNADDCDYGLIYRRESDGKLLSFTVSNVDYSVYSYSDEEGWVEIIPWTSSSAVIPGAYNQMGVVRMGDTYSFFVNGEELTTFDYSGIYSGQVGLNIDVFSENITCEFEFDNFAVALP